MRRLLALCAVMLLSAATQTFAHRLDEYLQATTFIVDGDHVEAQMRLTPGVQVSDRVLAAIDANGDGVISEAEQQAYAKHVSRDLSLEIDGYPLQVRLVSSMFPKLEEMKEGIGDILLNFEADLPQGGLNRRLTFENHHLSAISVYLVNCLVPSDPSIHVAAQGRNYDQSFYQLDYYPDCCAFASFRRPAFGQGSSPGWNRQVADLSLKHFSTRAFTTSSLAMTISCLSVHWFWQRRRFGT